MNVIVPCYNPPEGWAEALVGRFTAFREAVSGWTGETGLIVVNDGSLSQTTDQNFKRLSELLPDIRIVSYPLNRGKGHALRQGVAASDADLHLVTDADFPYTIASMQQVARALRDHGGIAAGNRDTAYYDRVPVFRRWLSRALRWMLRNVLRQPVGDSQCGLKAFDNQGKKIFLETTIDRFLFDLEFLMLANGRVEVTPVPVELREGVMFSKVGWKILATEGRNFIWLLLRR
ncbi:MAG: glycosyltransferase [Lewinellaceae bacterium]|jgi:glycosyltransferase involved in cell wall biosynthesis|nr:glycosyltransferase [Lewinellaceae bacterium]